MNYPRGHPDIEATVGRLLLSSTCRRPAWLRRRRHFAVKASRSDHRNDSPFFHSIPSCLSLVCHPFLFASPVSLSLSLALFLSVLNIFSGYLVILIHTSICSCFLSGSLSHSFSPTHPFSPTFLPIHCPSLHLLAQLLFYSAGWGVGGALAA